MRRFRIWAGLAVACVGLAFAGGCAEKEPAPVAPTVELKEVAAPAGPAFSEPFRLTNPRKLGSGADHQVDAIAVSPDSSMLAISVTRSNVPPSSEVHVWLIEPGEMHQSIEFEDERVSSVAFSPDSKTLAVGISRRRGDSPVKFYDAETGRKKGTIEQGGSQAIAYSADGATVATSDGIWNTKSLQRKGELGFAVSQVLAINEGRWATDGKVILSFADGAKVGEITDGRTAWGLSYQESLKVLASCDPDQGDVVFYDALERTRLNVDAGKLSQIGRVWGAEFVPNSNYLVTLNQDQKLHVWRYPSLEQVSEVDCPTRSIYFRVTPDARYVIAALDASDIRIWESEK